MSRDPVVEEAVEELFSCIEELRKAPVDDLAQEAVCLATRYALSTFLPAWGDSNGEYDKLTCDRLVEGLDDALALLPRESQYFRSVSERRKELLDYLNKKLEPI